MAISDYLDNILTTTTSIPVKLDRILKAVYVVNSSTLGCKTELLTAQAVYHLVV
jgi:hypothetical protein